MSETPRGISNQRRRGKHANLLIVGGVLAVMAAVLAFAARDVWRAGGVGPEVGAKPQAAVATRAEQKPATVTESSVIDDDGESLWVSPTDGPPLDLAYLPAGVEIILALRPEALATHPEGDKLLAAVNPMARPALQHLNEMLPGVHGVTEAIFGFNLNSGDNWPTTAIVQLSGHDSASSYIAIELTSARQAVHHGKAYWVANQLAYFAPGGDDDLRLVVAPQEVMPDIIDLGGSPPPLRPSFERIFAHTDSTRFLTIVAEPSVLFRHRDALFFAQLAPLQNAMESLFSNDVAVASVSFHWDDNFFLEFVAVPTLESSPAKLSNRLAEHVQAWPAEVERWVLNLYASPYSRRVVARLPEMVRRLAAYTRHGHDRDVAILRCYLPVTAGHNLLMATELALAEWQGGGKTITASQTASESAAPESIAERLQQKTTLRFGREELEAALHMLAEDVGVPISIRGQDLQLDGITRNQLFAIDLADRPAAEILVEILRRANPDKTATGPADPRQKLVYVVGASGIIITTRSQAAARGEELPSAFRAE